MTDDEIEQLLAAATPGPWYTGIDIPEPRQQGPGYWTPEDVYALSADPATAPLPARPPDTGWGEPAGGDDDWEAEVSEAWSAWAHEHEQGVVAETHNYHPIPDDQHDGNARLIAAAPTLIRELLDRCRKAETR